MLFGWFYVTQHLQKHTFGGPGIFVFCFCVFFGLGNQVPLQEVELDFDTRELFVLQISNMAKSLALPAKQLRL